MLKTGDVTSKSKVPESKFFNLKEMKTVIKEVDEVNTPNVESFRKQIDSDQKIVEDIDEDNTNVPA